MKNKNIVQRSNFASVLMVMTKPPLFGSCMWTIKEIIYNFFYLQYKAAIQKKVPVTSVDHSLDSLIPFTPPQVKIYPDFSPFWIRMLAFLIETIGKPAYPKIKDFIRSIGWLYSSAAKVYKKNFSTTYRPNYKKEFYFRVIHLFDPHLMCIPSLHVMVVVWTVIKFKSILELFNIKERYADQLVVLHRRAIEITESVLYIKQHSINCIAAALYAITSLDAELFCEGDAKEFINDLFKEPLNIKAVDCIVIRNYITELYENFILEGKTAAHWTEPLLNFLKNYSY